MCPSSARLAAAATLVAALAAGGCSRDLTTLEPASYPSTAEIFGDGFARGVDFQAFGDSKLNALSIDSTVHHSGTSSLRFTIPAPGDPSGGYAGGAFVDRIGRDLSGYDALTFWARASIPATLNVVGLGNDNTGTSKFTAQTGSIELTTEWKKYVIPIPAASRLTQERGLFFFAEGPENGAGYDVWFDDARFERLGTIRNPRPAIPSSTRNVEVGQTVPVQGATVTYTINGADEVLAAASGYFTFASSNPAIATVGPDGTITVVGAGTDTITATLGSVAATGAIVLNATAPPLAPAPAPTRPAADVISLFSNAYTNVPVDTWSAVWDQADVADVQIGGDDVKKYTNLAYAGIEFTSHPIDASAMTLLHLDVLVNDAAAFRVKLVDFGANGVFGGGDDSEYELALSPTSNPALVAGAWNSLDLPLSAFPGLASRRHLAQLIISGSSPTVYLDNLYFYRAPVPTAPTSAAPTPTLPAAQVISMYSGAYTNVPVDTWSAVWDQADLVDTTIAGNATKKYSNLVFAGIEATSQPIDASAMTGFHMDIWTPDPTGAPAAFRVKLVDFGANGTFGGGDDVEHELTFTAATTPALATGQWVAIDVPLSAFTGLVTRGHIAQLIISGDPKTVFVDNVYFYKPAAAATSPGAPAPAPGFAAGNVISLFSDAYTNVPVDTWSAVWDAADVADTAIAGNATKKYTNVVFAGIEFTSQPINATAMTSFMMDVWTPSPTAAPAVFRIKLVDFGANGAFGGGDDVEHELTFSASTVPALVTGNWIRFDIPLSAFTNLVTRGHLAQLIISGDLPTVYVDNVLFHN